MARFGSAFIIAKMLTTRVFQTLLLGVGDYEEYSYLTQGNYREKQLNINLVEERDNMTYRGSNNTAMDAIVKASVFTPTS